MLREDGLADPLDDSTWTNKNMIYHGSIKSMYSNIPEDKWNKIFGVKLKIKVHSRWQTRVVYILNQAIEEASHVGVRSTDSVELQVAV